MAAMNGLILSASFSVGTTIEISAAPVGADTRRDALSPLISPFFIEASVAAFAVWTAKPQKQAEAISQRVLEQLTPDLAPNMRKPRVNTGHQSPAMTSETPGIRSSGPR
jgi:hypothetical protein